MQSYAPGCPEEDMFHYVALTWNVESENQCAAARLLAERLVASSKQWGRAVDERGLCVFHETLRQGSLRACPLPHERGVLLGAAFHRNRTLDDPAPSARFVP